jgi:signal transduction histidine kinase
VVDDNPTNLSVLVEALKMGGDKVLVARDGEAALARARISNPTLILLDVMMPGMDGFEACRQLKADPATRDIPVIFMTALASVEDKVRGFEAGAVDYLTKPVQQAELRVRIDTHLRLRALTRQLHKANLELEALNATKDKFFSIIAHDLRAPFDALINYPKLMLMQLDRLDPKRLREMLKRMHRAAEATFQLLENLLLWARLQRGQMPYEPTTLRLAHVVDDSLHPLADMAQHKNIQLTNTVAATITIFGDKAMLETVLRNLAANALKFTPAGGQVRVTAEPHEPFVEIAVHDTGVGMPPEAQAKLFRVDTVHSTRGTAGETGSGLGLMLCKELVEKHGGALRVESVVGQGTTLVFTIPRYLPEGGSA